MEWDYITKTFTLLNIICIVKLKQDGCHPANTILIEVKIKHFEEADWLEPAWLELIVVICSS